MSSYNINALKIFVCNTKNWSTLDEENQAKLWCSESDLNLWKTIQNEKRKREFLAVRCILWTLNLQNELFYEGRIPKMHKQGFISISHSKDMVAVALSETHPVGVDIEIIGNKATRVMEKFVNEKERMIFEPSNKLKTTLLWSFKESVYKLIQEEGLHFKEQILVSCAQNGEYKGQIFTERGNFEVPLGHRFINDYVLTFNSGDVQRQA